MLKRKVHTTLGDQKLGDIFKRELWSRYPVSYNRQVKKWQAVVNDRTLCFCNTRELAVQAYNDYVILLGLEEVFKPLGTKDGIIKRQMHEIDRLVALLHRS